MRLNHRKLRNLIKIILNSNYLKAIYIGFFVLYCIIYIYIYILRPIRF
jgi:hypothetical protein